MFLGPSPNMCGKTTPLTPNLPARPIALLLKVWSAGLHHWFHLGPCQKCRISAHPTPLNQSLHFSQVPRAFVNPVEFENHWPGLPCGVYHFPPGLFQLIAMKSPVPKTPKTANFISEALQSQYPQRQEGTVIVVKNTINKNNRYYLSITYYEPGIVLSTLYALSHFMRTSLYCVL